MRDGVIYVATGAGYRALAVQSARSLKAWNPDLPVDLFTDAPEAEGLGIFDAVHPVPRDHPRVKLWCFAQSRFERTLFLDSDTLVLAPLGGLFPIADRFDLAMCHDVRRRSALVQEGGGVVTPEAFPQLNSGVMLYRKSPEALAFFENWRARFEALGAVRDQVPLKDLLWESDLRFYVLPPEYNLRRVTMLDAWEPLDALPAIIHSHRLLQHLRGHSERITSVARLLEAERAALAQEWAAVGAEPDPEDPVARFRAVRPG
ncbi:hypothetical protein PSA7680_01703 [Pseudoruegeria aquimaris]|uniref:Nucleotide-diphospho-sugar transferase n=1 Tax=Pseudoruegeria aquimaris TaxID=393663 RepID=A0A1Y5SBM0_9RHOB|nr:hypothetical protein [Pseudoruegeria aquimaris]SLN35892.1 hypothetical protein PSA7680_01703 [Pseudoruegeria aquimaris]